jgi:hypothetical protein
MSFTPPAYGGVVFSCVCVDVHTQGKTTPPYTVRVNNIQTRSKTITTTTGLCTENNTRTPGHYSIKNPKRGILNYIVWMSGINLKSY